jgi:hypothetical protein
VTRDPGLVIALDPSSRICGYAVLSRRRALVDAGSITPAARGDASWDRIHGMCDDLVTLLDLHEPGTILIEWTKGKVNKKRHGGLGAGLAVYGCGVGAIARECVRWARTRTGVVVVPIFENDWTRGQPKHDRQLAIAAAYPDYAPHLAADDGGDIADAIGLADWWLKESLFRTM